MGLIVQHFRGLKEHYNKASHGQGIYFATDTKEIILNGESYSGEGSESFSKLQVQVQENTDSLVVLSGTGEGSVVKIVNDAINDFATKISDDGTVNSFKELVDYVAEHGGEFSEVVVEIESIKEKDAAQDERIEALELLVGGSGEEGDGKSLVETVEEHAEAVSELQELVGETPVSQQISDALSWEDVE